MLWPPLAKVFASGTWQDGVRRVLVVLTIIPQDEKVRRRKKREKERVLPKANPIEVKVRSSLASSSRVVTVIMVRRASTNMLKRLRRRWISLLGSVNDLHQGVLPGLRPLESRLSLALHGRRASASSVVHAGSLMMGRRVPVPLGLPLPGAASSHLSVLLLLVMVPRKRRIRKGTRAVTDLRLIRHAPQVRSVAEGMGCVFRLFPVLRFSRGAHRDVDQLSLSVRSSSLEKLL